MVSIFGAEKFDIENKHLVTLHYSIHLQELYNWQMLDTWQLFITIQIYSMLKYALFLLLASLMLS